MEKEKPYLNPGFKLIDMQAVLPMNRTYLSQFIHAEYGCTFYQFVNRYRIEEAKRLKSEYPELRAQDVSARCGFSSPTVFSRTFTEMVGVSPREWSSQIHSA
jgi:AraC-like DNA-binding protein